MHDLRNTQTVENAKRVVGVQEGRDSSISQISSNVQLVAETSSLPNGFSNFAVAVHSPSYTVPAGFTLYVTAVHLSYCKTAADTGTDIYVNGTVGGMPAVLLRQVSVTLTATEGSNMITFPAPLAVTGTIYVTLTGTFTNNKAYVFGQLLRNY